MAEIIRAAHGDHTAMEHDIMATCKPQDECAPLDAVMLATEEPADAEKTDADVPLAVVNGDEDLYRMLDNDASSSDSENSD